MLEYYPFDLHSKQLLKIMLMFLSMTGQSNEKLTDPRIRKFFEGKNFAFLSSLMKDGSPHVTPTWVDIEDDNILINTALGRIKQTNISRGKVTEQITGDVAEKHIDKLARKYINLDKYPKRSKNEQRVILKIKPEKIFHMK